MHLWDLNICVVVLFFRDLHLNTTPLWLFFCSGISAHVKTQDSIHWAWRGHFCHKEILRKMESEHINYVNVFIFYGPFCFYLQDWSWTQICLHVLTAHLCVLEMVTAHPLKKKRGLWLNLFWLKVIRYSQDSSMLISAWSTHSVFVMRFSRGRSWYQMCLMSNEWNIVPTKLLCVCVWY